MPNLNIVGPVATIPTPHTISLAASTRRGVVTIWLLLAALAAAVSSLIWPAAHLDDEYLPVGNDSFYHARRILDTAADPDSFYEFDHRIHAPEGSLLVWPWGFDYAMGWLVRVGVAFGFANDPMAVLVWIPTAAVFISMGLIVWICQLLRLSLWATVLCGLCVAFSPLTQYLHGVGFVDHHFAEYIFVLAMLGTGLNWFANLSSARAAAALGLVLGIAPAVHNALFILQLPILVVLIVYWLQGTDIPKKSSAFLALGLLSATILILIPSLPIRMGQFQYYLLSWFHLYVASGSAIAILLLSKLRFSTRNLLLLGLVAAVLLAPLAYQITLARSFLTGQLMRLDSIAEMKSVRELAYISGVLDVSNRYSLLLWLTPFTLIYCVLKSWKERGTGLVLFWMWSAAGLVLLTMQFRLHYFGSLALYLPLIICIDRFARTKPARQSQILLAGSLSLLLLYAPPLRNQLLGPMPQANDIYFANLRPVLEALKEECKKDPGLVLADNDAGHYIRYYTQCSVIANNFLLTEQHGEKIRMMDHLLGLPASALPAAAPAVKYVLVRPVFIGSPKDNTESTVYMSFSPGSSQLVGDLLLAPVGDNPVSVPPEYELLFDSQLREGEKTIPYARLYRVTRDS